MSVAIQAKAREKSEALLGQHVSGLMPLPTLVLGSM